jgi:hypothetical protein
MVLRAGRRAPVSRRRSRALRAAFTVVALALAAAPLSASVSGHVFETDGLTPISGAQVRLQGTTAPVVVTAADGSYTLPVTLVGIEHVAASVPYDPAAAVHYNTDGRPATDGETGVDILLPRIPTTDGNPLLLPDSQFCGNCHAEQHAQWVTANHAGAAVDAWTLDLFSGTGTPGGSAGYVYKNLHDPGETGFCATCHAAIEDVTNPGNVMLDAVTAPAALDGVGCMTCHAVDYVNNNVDALNDMGNATYRFPTESPPNPDWTFVWGPLPDVILAMRNAESAVHRDSRFCASCHEYDRPGTSVPGQTTYEEWLASPYSVPGPGFRSCQGCHMPEAPSSGPIVSGGPDRPANQRHDHAFVGATPASLAAAIQLTATAQEVGGGLLQVVAQVTNQGAGHAFPSGVSIRNAILVVSASRMGAPLLQTSGSVVPFWADDDVAGQQPGDYAGQPGKGFARILQGRINDTGPTVRPVLFVDAESVYSDTLLASGQSDTSTLTFALPPGTLPGDVADVSVSLLYRRAFRATAVTKGWTQTPQGGPPEIEVAHQDLQVTLSTTLVPVKADLVHGVVRDLDLGASGVAGVDLFGFRQEPQSSYEVVVDGTTGDIGGAGSGPALDLVAAADGATVIQPSVGAGTGWSRSLRFENASADPVVDRDVRVRSQGCTTTCTVDDRYRIRAWETTLSLARFNNSATQITVLVLQNTTATTVTGHVWLRDSAGGAVASIPLTVAPHGSSVLNTSTVAPGVGGTLTVSHDAPYGGLVGKSVALEPATGFTFDAPLLPRSR